MVCFFVMLITRGEEMNITKFIQDHKDLSELPFLIVFRTILFLREMGMLKECVDADVDRVQP